MSKKSIKYPEALQMTLDGNPVVYGLDNYIVYLLDTCPEFNSAAKGIRAGARIESCIRNIGKDSKDLCLVLDADDADLLMQVCEEPSKGFPFLPARPLLRFIDAIKDASIVEEIEETKTE
jgi:hypothetical protein